MQLYRRSALFEIVRRWWPQNYFLPQAGEFGFP